MAWDYCTVEEAATQAGLSTEDFDDIWSEDVEGMINEYTGTTYTTAQARTESIDGTGHTIIKPTYTPIVAVSALTIGGTSVDASNYKVYPMYIEFIQVANSDIKNALGVTETVFPVGQQNITITYTSGYLSVPYMVKMCTKFMLIELARNAKRGGSDSVLLASNPTQVEGQRRVVDVSRKLNQIMKDYLDMRIRMG